MLEQVLAVFEGFRMPPTAIDEYGKGGREILKNKLAAFIGAGRTIEFLMLGYPFKSTNHRDKTIGELPDLAEEVSMQNFQRFQEQVMAIYPPGVLLNIGSDGYIFNDLLEESDCVVRRYGEVAVDMTRGTPVRLYSLMDFYRSESLPQAREKIMAQFGITDIELEQRILFDPNVNSLYRGMVKFMEEELANRSFPSRNQLHKAAKRLARAMMFRNEAYSQLVASEFASSIRLSMHPSTNNGSKYSFMLIPSPCAWTSPWHCALVNLANGQQCTIHRKDAEAAGHELVEIGGRPYYYQEVYHEE